VLDKRLIIRIVSCPPQSSFAGIKLLGTKLGRKHSRTLSSTDGVRHFEVALRGTSGEILLTVNDRGSGFDQQDAMNRHGLGLISMSERLQLVSGEFSINSQPGHGTTIYARVPLRTDEQRASVAG
jgi:signal transduction histidine kinase